MGYYDDHSQERYQKKSGRRGGYFFASIIGAIIGAMLVVISIPALSNQGFLPYNVQPNQNQPAGEQINNQIILFSNRCLMMYKQIQRRQLIRLQMR